MSVQQFAYDAQIERFVAQFIRLVSNFQVQFGKDANGIHTLQRVPVFYGDGSRQVASIIANNSENTMPTVPAMTAYISGLIYDRERIQDPTYVSNMSIRQRAWNETSQSFENKQGNAFTIERLMPVPYTLEMKLDIWTSNTLQKLQLIEQLVILFNPGMELQSTDNYIDWTSLSIVYIEGPEWSSRSVPIGTDNPIDVATLKFKMPIWLSAPAKVKQLGVIQKIVASLHDSKGDLSLDAYSVDNLLGHRQYFTPLDYGVLLIGNSLTLVKYNELEHEREPTLTVPVKVGTNDMWRAFINYYGVLADGISKVRLLDEATDTEVVGTVSYHPTDDTLLIFNADIDTYPVNTLSPIHAIIDPRRLTVDSSITNPATGTRYLILNDIGSIDNPIGSGPEAWRQNGADLVANANDIIQFDGISWAVVFDSQHSSSVHFVSNLNTGTQYKWEQGQWIKSFEGSYKPGTWTLVI